MHGGRPSGVVNAKGREKTFWILQAAGSTIRHMATYKKLSASAKSARIVAPKVAKARRVTVAKSTLGRVSAKATVASTARHGAALARVK